jgi:hypothetical protein
MALVSLILALTLVGPTVALAAAPVHQVTGSGYVEFANVNFRSSIAAFVDANGEATGNLVLNLDYSFFAIPKFTIHMKVTCLEVTGNEAWIGAVVTQSDNPNFVPIGLPFVYMVRDLGGEGQDIMHGEPFAQPISCHDHPFVEPTVLNSGNFNVK